MVQDVTIEEAEILDITVRSLEEVEKSNAGIAPKERMEE